ncbi:hypothetical protein [Paenibacillus methanolicus]|uniref:Uncharacterized protein n=1 Tax=Paenibacillus methanolicus TaxID=582686 RepID=A0A5S5C521_9BACL|nr:hypothetical protein [Paenibacillus methanolicus]TYP74531.1 hypothetical protein BCM02_10575 [Paenibacillus methanolicus]
MSILSSSFSVGAVSSEQTDWLSQKLTYSIVIQNPERIGMVDDADVILSTIIKDKVERLSSERIQDDDKGTITISGEVIFDARGMTKEEISQFNLLKGVQFMGDDNREYLLPVLR